ncbi:MAG: hypothetical protein H7A09_09110 [Oceanospirillaceae bacterium]|nr:hypothetical protein [Oceanospirillaceae bacterium]MCP5349618.1 hypothetical protein [Oceanospirillaceae bacterium]
MNEFCNSGYSCEDWYVLKDAVLRAGMKDAHGKIEIFDNLPPLLRRSEIGDLIYQAVYLGHKKAADKAAKILTCGSEQSWLILEKS